MRTDTSWWRTLRRLVTTVAVAVPRHATRAALATIALSITEGLGLLMLLPLLRVIGLGGAADPVGRLESVVAWVFSHVGLEPTLGLVLGMFVALGATHGLLQRAQAVATAAVQYELAAVLRMQLYRAIAGAHWEFYGRSRPSEFTHALTHIADRVGAASCYLIDLGVTGLVVLVYVGVALLVSTEVTTIVLCSALVVLWTLRGRVGDSHARGQQLAASSAGLYAGLSEHLAGMKLARCYGQIHRHTQVFDALSTDMRDANLRIVRGHARLRLQALLTSVVLLAAVVYLAVDALVVAPMHLLLLLFVFARLMPRLTGLVERTQTLAAVLPACAVAADLEARCQAAVEPRAERREPVALQTEIRFHHVGFDYGGGATAPALTDVGLIIPAGATTAIVGPSGAGKSTVADLLLGLMTPTDGEILVDGVRLGPARLQSWREQVAYVPQDPFLFHDTVRANLLWARPEATDDDLWQALGLAAANNVVAALPRGLDTVVGDRGVLLSGGERQRLSLARALLRRPRLLVLDEATSAVDARNEARIQHAIDQLHERMTIVVIAHRLSTVRSADVIYVLDRGAVVESGTWVSLMAQPASRLRAFCVSQEPDSAPLAELDALTV